MPRYYFHVQDGRGVRDDSGKEFPNDMSARNELERLAACALVDRPEIVWRGGWSIDVMNDTGTHLFALHVFTTISPIIRKGLRLVATR